MQTVTEYFLIFCAAIAAGAINALAGGGTLITFPALIALGIPAVSANMTNTVALLPGYLGGTFAQLKDLKGQENRLWLTIPAGLVGGILGGVLLLTTGEKVFRQLIPFLILLAACLLAIQEPLRKWILKRIEQNKKIISNTWVILPVGVAAIYGGYFGAGLSVIVLAVLALIIEDSLTRLNALKQIVGFSVNFAAAIYFVFSGQVVWAIAGLMAVGALIGGGLGGKLAGQIKPSILRWAVVSMSLVVSIVYFAKG